MTTFNADEIRLLTAKSRQDKIDKEQADAERNRRQREEDIKHIKLTAPKHVDDVWMVKIRQAAIDGLREVKISENGHYDEEVAKACTDVLVGRGFRVTLGRSEPYKFRGSDESPEETAYSTTVKVEW